jgi:hypothetical protein
VSKEEPEVSLLYDMHVAKKQKNRKLVTVKMVSIQARNFIGKQYIEWLLHFDEDLVKF